MSIIRLAKWLTHLTFLSNICNNDLHEIRKFSILKKEFSLCPSGYWNQLRFQQLNFQEYIITCSQAPYIPMPSTFYKRLQHDESQMSYHLCLTPSSFSPTLMTNELHRVTRLLISRTTYFHNNMIIVHTKSSFMN